MSLRPPGRSPIKRRNRLDIRKYIVSNILVESWNRLSALCVNYSTLNKITLMHIRFDLEPEGNQLIVFAGRYCVMCEYGLDTSPPLSDGRGIDIEKYRVRVIESGDGGP